MQTWLPMHMSVSFLFAAWVTRTVEDQLTHQKRQKAVRFCLMFTVQGQEYRGVFRGWRLKAVNYFCKNLHLGCSNGFLIRLLSRCINQEICILSEKFCLRRAKVSLRSAILYQITFSKVILISNDNRQVQDKICL